MSIEGMGHNLDLILKKFGDIIKEEKDVGNSIANLVGWEVS
jgi:hypothetical protein